MADDVEDGVVYAAAMSDDDEVVDAVANTGNSCHSLDAPNSDNGVLHVKAMAEEDDEEEDESSALASNEPPLNVQDAPNDDWPLLDRWRWTPDGAVCGYVHGKEGFRDGELMTTSIVNPEGRFPTYIITDSGSAYRLGEQASGSGGMRRSSRAAVGKDSLLDAFADSIHTIPGAPGLRYAVGGADVGGITAEKIMRSSFSVLDDNLVNLRAQYQTARRVVLLNGDTRSLHPWSRFTRSSRCSRCRFSRRRARSASKAMAVYWSPLSKSSAQDCGCASSLSLLPRSRCDSGYVRGCMPRRTVPRRRCEQHCAKWTNRLVAALPIPSRWPWSFRRATVAA